jgi:bla regulator protein BlaR1
MGFFCGGSDPLPVPPGKALAVGTLVRFGARQRPHLAHTLWMVVILKCLTPPLWSSPTGIFSWA